MKSVKVLYPKKNYSAFSFRHTQKIDKFNYDENDEFVDREQVEPSIDHYEVVSTLEFEDERSNDEIFGNIVRSHNIGSYPKKITKGIKSGELNVSHSSFSSGDIIQIKGNYYISDGISFDLLPLEFSNDN